MEATVRIVNEQVTEGIAERDFEVEVAGERVPACSGPRPTVPGRIRWC
jgi:hypothetical protein